MFDSLLNFIVYVFLIVTCPIWLPWLIGIAITIIIAGFTVLHYVLDIALTNYGSVNAK